MNPRYKALPLTFLATCGFIFGLSAEAMPFQETPQALHKFDNTSSWKDGASRIFTSIGECEIINVAMINRYYACGSGFVRISGPMGD